MKRGYRIPASERAPRNVRGLPADWHQVSLTMPGGDLDGLDERVDRVKRAGIAMSRSKLIRIALKELDMKALIAQLKEVQ